MGLMASSFTIVTECAKSSAAMFDVSLDIDVHLTSMSKSGEQAISGITSGAIDLGETVTWRARHFGMWFTMTSKITSLDRPHHFVDEQVEGPFQSFTHVHLFEDIPDGCRMTDTVTVASPIFGVVAERLVLVPYLRRLIQKRNLVLIKTANQ